MSEENQNAFKLWISGDVVKKYFKHTKLSKKEIDAIIKKLSSLELKARVQLIARELKDVLPEHYPHALKELLQITRKENLKSFELWPTTEFIQMYGLDYTDRSLEAMYELTSKFTAEFSIRPFINKYGHQIYDKLLPWKQDQNEHIRRWLSEGTRPRLPWGEKLHAAVKDPKKGLEILEHLKFDPSLYVRKSVANHLNDIAKDHPELVVSTLLKWQKQVPKNYLKEFNFISNRALRTLIKDGHEGALQFTGVALDKKSIKCSQLTINKNKFKMGEKLELNFSVQNKTKENLKYIIDYVIYFKKANGDLSPKVFKLKTGTLKAFEKINITKNHNFKPITTRKFYPGEHQISVKINGRETEKLSFNLRV
ncbi:MAG: DNA alkylation repair protein [Pseudobdellovibrio sp.]